ncbi:MAG: multiheme c-type cytochrome, partial [Pyrinomonadaceae bacterium]
MLASFTSLKKPLRRRRTGLAQLIAIAVFAVVAAFFVFSSSPVASTPKSTGSSYERKNEEKNSSAKGHEATSKNVPKGGLKDGLKEITPEEISRLNLPDGYVLPFGSNPFAPSNAATTTGKIITADKFLPASRCTTCHADVHAQWLQSPHRNAFREPFYQKNVKDLISQRGIEFTRHCESCHNPAALFSGALTKDSKVKRPFDNDGVSCIVCHSIQTAENRGVGGYVMGEPALLLKGDGTRLLKVSNSEIKDDVPSHKRAMMRPLLKSPEFCAACHKSQVPHELNDYKFLRAFAVYDEYQMSSFSKQTPHPFYARDLETCNTCHMKREAAPLDLAAKLGTIISHRWAAANTAIPTFYKYNDQLKLVKNFLENNTLGVDIFALRKRADADLSGKEELVVPINRNRFTINSGDVIT